MNFGVQELVIILVIALVIFGPSQIPKLGRGLGESIREFRKVGTALTETHADLKDTARQVERELKS